MFQSSPGPRGPGVIAYKANCREWELVSILARPSRAGRRYVDAADEMLASFQSSPGPRGPGVELYTQRVQRSTRFNPRPALAGRASSLCPRHGRDAPCFNPRPALAGRASSLCPRHGRDAPCFNPRPALAGRASPPWRRCGGRRSVSILARPSRAGRRPANPLVTSSPMFQSSPGPRGPGVAYCPRPFGGNIMFQSSPGPRGPGVKALPVRTVY